MTSTESLVLKTDVESDVAWPRVEYIQRVISLIGRTGHVETRSERLLDVAACQHVALGRRWVLQFPPVDANGEVRQTW